MISNFLPLEEAPTITSHYGMRYHPVLKKWKMHNGTDFKAAIGTKLYAIEAGHVSTIFHKTGGVIAKLVTQRGFYLYCHCSQVKVNGYVKQGDLIALGGDTGMVTGAHLHLEYSEGGKKRDPYLYLKKINNLLLKSEMDILKLLNKNLESLSNQLSDLRKSVDNVKSFEEAKLDKNSWGTYRLNYIDGMKGRVVYLHISNDSAESSFVNIFVDNEKINKNPIEVKSNEYHVESLIGQKGLLKVEETQDEKRELFCSVRSLY